MIGWSRALGGAVAGAVLAAAAAAGAAERISVESATYAGLGEVFRGGARETVSVPGTLSMPAGRAGPVPAVVLVAGSGGVGEREAEWARTLNDAGLASLVIDSFGARGIRETATDQSRLAVWSDVADAFAALGALAARPDIDKGRIAILGASRGGQVALYTALEPLRARLAPGGARFAAHVALYPYCNTRYESGAVTRAPVAFLLAESDDYTPMKFCLPYAEWFRAKGATVQTTTYPDAHHGFDRAGSPEWLSRVATGRACDAVFDLGAQTMKVDGARVLTGAAEMRAYFDGCRKFGATVGGRAAAARQARLDVVAFLRASGVAAAR